MMVEPDDYKEFKTVDDMPGGMREYPFIYPGMSIEEYCKERNYYYENWPHKVHEGTYEPLWKQRGENHK